MQIYHYSNLSPRAGSRTVQSRIRKSELGNKPHVSITQTPNTFTNKDRLIISLVLCNNSVIILTHSLTGPL